MIHLTPQAILNLFLKYDVKHIPIVSNKETNKEIKSYVSKNKILRQANHHEFFEKPLTEVLSHLLQDIDNEIFFQELDTVALEDIPIIDADNFSVKTISYEDFNAKYRPITHLPDDFYKEVFEKLHTAIVFFNSKREIIFSNRSAQDLVKRYLGAEERGDKFLKLFSDDKIDEIITLFDGADKKKKTKVHLYRQINHTFYYKCDAMSFGRGKLYVLMLYNVIEKTSLR